MAEAGELATFDDSSALPAGLPSHLPAPGCAKPQRARVFEFGLNDASGDPRPFVAQDLYDPSAAPIVYGHSGASSSGRASDGSRSLDMEEMNLSTDSSRWVREYLSKARGSQWDGSQPLSQIRLDDIAADVQLSQDLEGFQQFLAQRPASGEQLPSDAKDVRDPSASPAAQASGHFQGEKRLEMVEAPPVQDGNRPARARVFEFGVNQSGDEPYFAQDFYDPSAVPVNFGNGISEGAADDDDDPVKSTESGVWMRQFLEARIRGRGSD